MATYLTLRVKLTLAFILLAVGMSIVSYFDITWLLYVAVAVFGLIGFGVATQIVKSIDTVRAGAEHIASGDFSRSIPIETKDEVGQLAAAFNQMAARLRDSYSRAAFQRQRDETLLESMGEGLIATDERGTVVLINSQAANLLGRGERDSIVNTPIDNVLELYSQDDKQLLPPDLRPASMALLTARTVSDVFSYHKSDGDKKLIHATASPVVVDGKSAGVVVVIRDVTKEREVDRMKTEFISLASHQLRTPLSAIRWFTEMLMNGDAGNMTDEQKEFVKNVYDSTDRMIQLVGSLLNISRIESGRIMVEPKPTDLNKLVGGIVNDLKAKTEQRQQTLLVNVHPDLPLVNLDPHLIGQVYLNFLTNAIKYTPKGGEISVFVSRKGDELISQVSDNGYGIPKKQHDRVFQKFFRAENVVKVETDGTGLGLYLVKSIIESSGGRVWFESEEGKGTTFWFSLPMSGMKAKEGEVTLD